MPGDDRGDWDGQQIPYHSNYGFTYFEHQDWEGSDRIRTDPSGAIAAGDISLPFGDGSTQTVGGTMVNQDNNSFACLELDQETETYHAQFRQYGPGAGSWMSPDPYAGSYDMNNPQSFNRYSYVLNNPLTFTDPGGQFTEGPGLYIGGSICGPVCAAIGFGIGALADALGLDALFSGGPSFHGSLQPRPNAANDPGSLGESLGIPTSIPQGNWGIGMALNLPSECEFGTCGGGIGDSFQAGAATAPGSWCLQHPKICTAGIELADVLEKVPPIAASVLLLNMKGDSSEPVSSRWSKFPGCSAQYQQDIATCQKRKTSSCWASAAERLASCNASGGAVGWPPLKP